jgi:hypothetical protein
MQDATPKTSRVDPKIPKINPEWKEGASKNNLCASNRAKRAMVPENFCGERDSGFRWYIPQKDEDPKRFLPLDERKKASLIVTSKMTHHFFELSRHPPQG